MLDGLGLETNEDKCVGCNKCIFVCPTHANDAYLTHEANRIHVNDDLCIRCGECMDVCDHAAREITDDTVRFFDDLSKGEEISIIAAPAIKHNIPEYNKLFGYLKSLGVKVFYDVSYGADITTWGYIKAYTEHGAESMIAQPCPVIVNYIEHFQPSLIKQLAPVHSPAMCTAIYMKKYREISGKIAFLSPCISKSNEFEDPNTHGMISYNVTYKELLKYLADKKVDLADYPEINFDNVEGSLGFTFSRPGGLRENVKLYLGSTLWIKQIEGIKNVQHYFVEYEKRVAEGKPVPQLIDVLNCEHGCNVGTGTNKTLEIDQIDYQTNQMKYKLEKRQAEELMAYFDKTLTYEDFVRSYNDKSHVQVKATEKQLEEVFTRLEKYTPAERKINCFACGYGNCYDFANAVALGQNHIENCFNYSQKLLHEQALEIHDKNEAIVSSLEYASKIQRNLLPARDAFDKSFHDYEVLWHPKDIVGGDIYWFRQFEDGALLCVCDCTGHGTPGALLTMLVATTLDSIINKDNYSDLGSVMMNLDKRMVEVLNVVEKNHHAGWKNTTSINDGADLALLCIKKTGEITIAAGNTHVFICDGKEVQDIKGQKIHVGEGLITSPEMIEISTIKNSPNLKYYVASDGLFDQIGAASGIPFGYRKFKSIINEKHDAALKDIFEEVWCEFEAHRGEECRRDDVAFVGFVP